MGAARAHHRTGGPGFEPSGSFFFSLGQMQTMTWFACQHTAANRALQRDFRGLLRGDMAE